MLALTSATGKLGGAVLDAILEHKLIDTKDLVVCTSSDPTSSRFSHLHASSITVRQANFNDASSLTAAFKGCTSLFLVSTPAVEMDYNNAPLWSGREAHHRAAIDAAMTARVQHIYYTSLGFASPSKAGVMRAHIRTEAYLHELARADKLRVTVLREGLYNESWPLYFGYYFALKEEERREVLVAGDGPVSWTSIADMAYATARVLAHESGAWAGRTVYLSQRTTASLADVARIVGAVRGVEVKLKVVDRKTYEDYYVQDMGMERPAVEWWSSTYEALEDGECAVDDPTLEGFLKEAGREPKPLEDTIREMLK
ncbi:nad(P)-binding protein [Stemphylium lycopersici]|uniref:Nad(P)-binding protein n=1 Tax=Stemphylium lycopersici TaxID=183478 RepID=A0A364NB26_STELY|nr:nad(P)-binding protein [Stemphylium lycopersici]RAR14462.1 nad(P)-binding protein [Stemphylium lycopersici]